MTGMPSENIGVVQSATVSALGEDDEGDITSGPIPEAYVNADVWAGEFPNAKAIPGHSNPGKVNLKVDAYAYWEGEATARVTRSHVHPSTGEVVPEPPKNESKIVCLMIRRKKSNGKQVLVWGLTGVFVGGLFGHPGIGVALGAAYGATQSKEFNYIDTEVTEELVLEADPLPGYVVYVRQGNLRIPRVEYFQVIRSSAYLTGTWTNMGVDDKPIRGSGGEVLYHVSHAHLVPPSGASYGPLHHE